MGGLCRWVIGYRSIYKQLFPEPAGAVLVYQIFERYLALGSVHALQKILRDEGVVSRIRTF